jgi:hypothetical protein
MRSLMPCVFVVAACNSVDRSPLPAVAVGTYIGEGSIIMGPNHCTYEGSATVFAPDGGNAPGPRLVTGAGTIIVHCQKHEGEAQALVPTGVKLDGPTSAMRGGTSESFEAHLVAGTQLLAGKGTLEWSLGKDCNGVAAFSAVSGSQDSGRERGRSLDASANGTCTVIATITTDPSPTVTTTFHAERLVTIR